MHASADVRSFWLSWPVVAEVENLVVGQAAAGTIGVLVVGDMDPQCAVAGVTASRSPARMLRLPAVPTTTGRRSCAAR